MSSQQNATLIGFRRWLPDYKNLRLYSCVSKFAWQPGVNEARCQSHEAPARGCHCGFNAYYEFKSSRKNYSGVLGAIQAAGDVELHPTGFRAAEARIVALYSGAFVSKTRRNELKEIADTYGVPLFERKKDFLNHIKSLRPISSDDIATDFLFTGIKEHRTATEHYRNGVLHRDGDQPAVEYRSGAKIWYRDGEKHRLNDLAAVQYQDGQQEWWVDGHRHRGGDKPALVSQGYQAWYLGGVLHRKNGPAEITPTQEKYYEYGRLYLTREKEAPGEKEAKPL